MTDVRRYQETINNPTSIFIDINFMNTEFINYRTFYANLYSGNTPEYPKKILPEKINPRTLIDAICKYCHANSENVKVFLFKRVSDTHYLDDDNENLTVTINCTSPVWSEMGKIMFSYPDIKRVIIFADDQAYLPLINTMIEKDYDIGLVKHKMEGSDDFSEMPVDIPYQFSYYVIGESLGLKQDEL